MLEAKFDHVLASLAVLVASLVASLASFAAFLTLAKVSVNVLI